MAITSYLAEDHRAIEEMLGTIEAMCQRLEAGYTINSKHLHAAMEWIREFVGGWHLNKEEHLLFPTLARASAPEVKEIIDDFLKEHHMERHLFAKMAASASSLQHHKKNAARLFCRDARKYIAELSSHIRKEDEQFYPVVNTQLDEQSQATLLEAHQQLEEKMGKQWLESMMETLQKLSAAYPAK